MINHVFAAAVGAAGRQSIGRLGGGRRSDHADVLRAAHAEPLRRAARQIEPRAHAVGGAVRPGVVDAHRERPAVVRVGHGQRAAERPAARRRGVAAGVEAFAGRRARAGPVVARQHFLSGAFAGRLDVSVDRIPARRAGRRDAEQARQERDAEMFH